MFITTGVIPVSIPIIGACVSVNAVTHIPATQGLEFDDEI